MRVQCRRFESTTKSWEALVEEAATFATSIGRDRLINISVSAAGGSDTFALAPKVPSSSGTGNRHLELAIGR